VINDKPVIANLCSYGVTLVTVLAIDITIADNSIVTMTAPALTPSGSSPPSPAPISLRLMLNGGDERMSPKAGELNEADGGPKGARTVLFGEALASAMAAAGVSQNELAAQMNVKQPTVSAWCNADAEPRYEVVFAIERALGAKPGQLSRILGYLPMEAVRITGGVEESIRDDPMSPPSEAGFRRVRGPLLEALVTPSGHCVGSNVCSYRKGGPVNETVRLGTSEQ
jgi:transcriptional regulator with XRE-family HTH domain